MWRRAPHKLLVIIATRDNQTDKNVLHMSSSGNEPRVRAFKPLYLVEERSSILGPVTGYSDLGFCDFCSNFAKNAGTAFHIKPLHLDFILQLIIH
jgi:hypothetical protein